MTTNPVNNYTEMHARLERLLVCDDVDWDPSPEAIYLMKRCAFAAWREAQAAPLFVAQTPATRTVCASGGSSLIRNSVRGWR